MRCTGQGFAARNRANWAATPNRTVGKPHAWELVMLRYSISAGLIAVLVALGSCAAPQAHTTQSLGDNNTRTGATKVVVKSVSGLAARLACDDKNGKRKRIKVGDTFSPEDCLIRTGIASKMVLKFTDGHDVNIGSATKIGLSLHGELTKSGPGLKYGKSRAKINTSYGNVGIRTPVGTLAASSAGSRIGRLVLSFEPNKATTRPSGDTKARSAFLKTLVKSVRGIAERRDGKVKNSKWEPLKVGDILSEHSVVRTGLGGNAVIELPDGGDATIKSATKVAISSITGCRKPVKTRFGLTFEEAIKQIASMSGDESRIIHLGCLGICYGGTDATQWPGPYADSCGPWALKVRKGSSSIYVGQWTSHGKAQLLCDLLSAFGEDEGKPYVEGAQSEDVEQRKPHPKP